MMKERSLISSVGVLLYVVLSFIDKFIYKIENHIYIPLALLGIIIIIVGFIVDRKKS